AAAKAKRGALVIVDACRDDPFVEARAVAASRAAGSQQKEAIPPRLHSGLATTAAVAPNSVVLYSTAPGEVALDGEGLDSPFVRALLETLATPNQPFETVVRDTTAGVIEKTNGQQKPAAYGSAPAIALLPPAIAR
ncbi:MAG: caspase family protein, partial [Xanthobacteraceae bacterium]